jgi:putative sterol carrier protein
MTLLDPYLFEALLERSCERPMPVVDGVLRMDVTDGDAVEHWYLTMKKGTLKVAQDGGKPDCTVSGDHATFAAILSGRANAMAALLRGALHAQGKVVLLTALQRRFPGSPGAAGLPPAGYAERQS